MEVIEQTELCLKIIHFMKIIIGIDNLMLKNLLTIMRRKRNINILLTRLIKRRKFTVNRRIWKLERTSNFWEDEVKTYSDSMFKDNFRVNRNMFTKLVQLLPCLSAQHTNLRPSIPLDKRIAIAMYALGTSAEYRTVANLFGVGRTTVGEIVRDFCNAVCLKLQETYLSVYPPDQEKLQTIITGFDKMGFPQCMGAIDGCHIEVCPPKSLAVDYYNYKGWYSIVLLAVADHRYNFTYINVGSPGRNNDSYIFENSAIKEEHSNNEIYINNSRRIQGISVPVLLIGDSAFKLTKFMMKPFPYKLNQPVLEKTYNYRLSKCRRVIENAFGRLKARFRRLLKGLEVNIDNVPLIITACCILNNFCNDSSDYIPVHWTDDLGNASDKEQPAFVTHIADTTGVNIRNAIANYFG